MRLAGGPTASDAAAIYTGRGRLAFRAGQRRLVDPTTGQGMPVGPGRPFIVVSGGGRVDAVDSAISDLGTEPAGPAPRAGLGLGATQHRSRWCTRPCCATASVCKLDRTRACGWRT